MEWDQYIFKKVSNLFRRIKSKRKGQQLQGAAFLGPNKSRFALVASALCGRKIEIATAESTGGIRGNVFYLPDHVAFFQESDLNKMFYILRLCMMSREIRWKQAPPNLFVLIRDTMREFPKLRKVFRKMLASLREASDSKKTSVLREKFRDALRGVPIPASSLVGEAEVGLDEVAGANNAAEIQSEINAKPREYAELLQKNKKAQQDYTLMHNFEKIETLDEFSGRWRDFDGDDDLEEHAEALDELNLRHMIRTNDPSHSVYKNDFLGTAFIPESVDQEVAGYYIAYPEYDYRKKKLKPDFCKVFPRAPKEKDSDFLKKLKTNERKTLAEIKKRVHQFEDERVRVRRLMDGPEIDIDVITDNFSELAAGHSPDERMYIQNRPGYKDFTVSIIMDISLSTDAFLENRHILTTEKNSVGLFAEALEEVSIPFSIAAFASQTRNQINSYTIKNVQTSWEKAAPFLGGLRAEGYTRIGPALRHTTAEIKKRNARHKWILLLTDGKPNDFDRYEGEYGIADVRAAVAEARKENVHIYSLALEKQARFYFARMFGARNFKVLSHLRMLPEALLYFYESLVKSGR